MQFIVRLFMTMRSGRAPLAEWRLTGQESLFYWHIATVSHCSTEAHLADVPFPRWGKAAVRVWKVSLDVDAKKHTGSVSY